LRSRRKAIFRRAPWGSHIRLSLQQTTQHHLTIPNHHSIKVGTLAAIVADVSAQLDMPRDEVMRILFG
jgi:hypothetical protein